MPAQQSRAPVWPAILLAVLLFCIYNLNFRHGSGIDTIPTTALPASIIADGNFNLERSRGLLSTNTRALEACLVYFGCIQERNGHLVSSYPLGAAIMAVPVFAIAKYAGYLKQWHNYRVAGKIAASSMVALSALFVFLTLSLSIETKAAWIIALFFGLGTSAWSISSQDLWQHGPGTLCLAIATYSLCLFERRPSHRTVFLAGFFLGFAVCCRMTNAIPAAALTLFVLIHHRKYLPSYIAPLAVFAAFIAYYNLTTYGDIRGGYNAIFHSKIHGWRNLEPSDLFTHPLWKGFANVLVSPSRGLLIYSPFLVPAFLASIYLAFRPKSALQRYLILWVILTCIVLAKNLAWWGGASFGPRYFSETCVALTLLAGAAWPYIKRHRILQVTFLASGVLSIVIHGIGAFFAPCGWELTPVPNDLKLERHWDWRDTEIMRCGNSGLTKGFKPPEILLFKNGDEDI
jgi:MFS family permease